MICLLQMPFSNVTQPCLSLSIFKAELKKQGIPAYVEYAGLHFLKETGILNYTLAAENWQNFIPMAGEFMFLRATGLSAKKTSQEYRSWLQDHYVDCLPVAVADKFIAELPQLEQKAQEFVNITTERILAHKPKVIACASTYLQINSSIAVLKCLKEKNPDLVTIVGGANCSGAAGVALVNDIPWIDYTFSGEADECIAEFCELALKYGNKIPQALLPYGVLAKGAFQADAQNLPCRITKDLDTIAIPDFDDYFETIDQLQLRNIIEPGLNVEFSRGCWWGEKHPCTFCGLNGQINKYRIKSAERVLAELAILAERYQMKKFALADNILSQEHLKDLIPKLIAGKADYIFFAEIKSNISAAEMQQLYEAGFQWLQPGLESLHDSVLQTMNKGNKAIKHIEFLKNAQQTGITLAWNLIGGFPLEEEAWYSEMAKIMELITHLRAPSGFKHIVFQRYNVYLNNPESYGIKLKPATVYDYVFPDLPNFTQNVAYQYEPFDSDAGYTDIGKKGAGYLAVRARVLKWIASDKFNPDRLEYWETKDAIEIMDLRPCAVKMLHYLQGVHKEIYQASQQVLSLVKLQVIMADKFTPTEIIKAVDELVEDKILVKIGQEVLALAVKRWNVVFADKQNLPTGYIKRSALEVGDD